MKVIYGDLIKQALTGKLDVIVHGTNCFCNMDKGLSRIIKHVFPEAHRADLETETGALSKLGTITYAKIIKNHHEIIVVNGYTEFRCTGLTQHHSYNSIRAIMEYVKKEFSGKKIGYPKLGTSRAGDNWRTVSQIINEVLVEEDHTLVILNKNYNTNYDMGQQSFFR